jgi:hypothetical protein
MDNVLYFGESRKLSRNKKWWLDGEEIKIVK